MYCRRWRGVVQTDGASVSSSHPLVQELRLQLSNGQDCALLMFGPEQAPPILALHGWQDNAASFLELAALLPEYRVIALDFPGHGLSARRPLSSPYYIWSYIAEIRGVVEHFGWPQFTLMGHSMGGAVACLYAALYPQELSRLILLDILGPVATAPTQLPAQMREALAQLDSLKARQRHYYSDFQSAVQARAEKGLSLAAATQLGQRGIVCDEQGCYWSFDPRLRVLSPMSLSEEQVAAFMQEVVCPALIVLSTVFWQKRRMMYEQRKTYLRHATIHELAGSHHQHMEAQAAEIAALIKAFLI